MMVTIVDGHEGRSLLRSLADGIILVVITAALRNLNSVISFPIITLLVSYMFDSDVTGENKIFPLIARLPINSDLAVA